MSHWSIVHLNLWHFYCEHIQRLNAVAHTHTQSFYCKKRFNSLIKEEEEFFTRATVTCHPPMKFVAQSRASGNLLMKYPSIRSRKIVSCEGRVRLSKLNWKEENFNDLHACIDLGIELYRNAINNWSGIFLLLMNKRDQYMSVQLALCYLIMKINARALLLLLSHNTHEHWTLSNKNSSSFWNSFQIGARLRKITLESSRRSGLKEKTPRVNI